jgi:S-adenosyl methyltransferase
MPNGEAIRPVPATWIRNGRGSARRWRNDGVSLFVPRSGDGILKLFNGRPLVDPGLVLVSRWRPDEGEPGYNADRAWAYGGIARL